MNDKMHYNSHIGYHILALLISCIWGSTFVASKILLNAGLTPSEIMCLRFAIAYVIMLPFCHAQIKAHSIKDELLFAALGLSGGSLYFLAENTAVELTTSTSTVALLVSTTPILTALAFRMCWKEEKLSSAFMTGSAIALVGVTLVIFNGVFVLDDNPLVILLAFGAAVTWAIYGMILRVMEPKYDSAVITRKVFFWGVLTMLPVCFIEDNNFSFEIVSQPRVYVTLIFLSIIASLFCFHFWNVVTRKLTVVVASNYLYFNPVTSLITAYFVLSERITLLAIIGCILTILGVYMCNRKH